MIELRGITWDHPRGWGGVRAAAETFRAERPDVRVTWEVRTLQAFADQPIEDLAARFDLIVLDHPSIGASVARGALLPLDAELDPAVLAEQARGSVGRSFESYSWRGHQWALAIDAAAQVAAYRPDLVERADASVPETWEGSRSLTDALHRHGLAVAMPAIPVDAICGFLGTCRSLGEDPCAGPDVVVARDAGREALAILRDVVGKAHPQSLEWNPPTVLERMANTDEIAYVPVAFGYANFARPGFARHVLRFAPAPGRATHAGMPIVPSGTLGGAGLAVSASSAHIEEACAYAAFVASPDVQRSVYVEGGGQPGHRAAWTAGSEDDGVGPSFFAPTLEALDQAYLRPRYDGFLGFQEEAGDLVHAFLASERDHADGVLDDLDRSYRASLGSKAGVAR